MEEKKIDPIRPGMTSNSSSPLPSMYGNDFLELVWENGQIVVQGGSPSTSSRSRKRPSCIGYSLNPCLEGYDEDPCITKRARPSTLYSLLDSSHQNSQPSYLVDFNYTKSNSFSNKLELEFSNSRAGSKETNSKTTVGNTQLCSSSSHSHKHEDSGSDQRIGKLNFSNFLKPALFLKSGCLGNNATPLRNGDVSARVEELKAGTRNAADADSEAADHSLVIDSANKGSHSLNGIQHHEDQPALTSQKANQTDPINVAKSDEKTLLPDQHSKTQGSHALCHHQTHKAKGKFAAQFYNEPMVVSSSLCSLGASNNPTLRSRKHEDTDDSNYTSDNEEEEEEDVIKETPSREGSRGKRSRNAAIHNLSERKRRDKINKKMRALKELIPNCNKMDKASMLDDVIDYLKTLKLQLQVMSMGSSLCMPLMMLGGGGHHLAQLMGGGMSLRPSGSGIGVPYRLPLPQFPLHAHAHSITDNPLHMLGFPNHMLPVPFSMSPPFIPIPPKHLPPNLSTPHSTTTSTLHASLPNNKNPLCAQSGNELKTLQ